jgi:plastocyanin
MKLVALAALVAVLAVPSALAATPALRGADGPGFTITLTKNGKTVTKLKLEISDKSGIHDFHLVGPGVDKKTSVGANVATTWKLKLKRGMYTYVCDPHKSLMNGSFKVT